MIPANQVIMQHHHSARLGNTARYVSWQTISNESTYVCSIANKYSEQIFINLSIDKLKIGCYLRPILPAVQIGEIDCCIRSYT